MPGLGLGDPVPAASADQSRRHPVHAPTPHCPRMHPEVTGDNALLDPWLPPLAIPSVALGEGDHDPGHRQQALRLSCPRRDNRVMSLCRGRRPDAKSWSRGPRGSGTKDYIGALKYANRLIGTWRYRREDRPAMAGACRDDRGRACGGGLERLLQGTDVPDRDQDLARDRRLGGVSVSVALAHVDVEPVPRFLRSPACWAASTAAQRSSGEPALASRQVGELSPHCRTLGTRPE